MTAHRRIDAARARGGEMNERVIVVARELGEPFGLADECVAAAAGVPQEGEPAAYAHHVAAAINRVLVARLEACIREAERGMRKARHAAAMEMLIGKAMAMPVQGWH